MAHYVVFSKREGFPRVDRAERVMLRDMNLDIQYIMRKAREELKKITPRRTGKMQGNIKTWGLFMGSLGGFRFSLGWRKQDFKEFYPPYVDLGTGLYGKFKRLIMPIRANRLAWQYGDEWCSAVSIKGQKPQGLLRRATDSWVTWFKLYMEKKRITAYRKTL